MQRPPLPTAMVRMKTAEMLALPASAQNAAMIHAVIANNELRDR